jgi:uncharacterized Zn finger protein (UPF0148 family)
VSDQNGLREIEDPMDAEKVRKQALALCAPLVLEWQDDESEPEDRRSLREFCADLMTAFALSLNLPAPSANYNRQQLAREIVQRLAEDGHSTNDAMKDLIAAMLPAPSAPGKGPRPCCPKCGTSDGRSLTLSAGRQVYCEICGYTSDKFIDLAELAAVFFASSPVPGESQQEKEARIEAEQKDYGMFGITEEEPPTMPVTMSGGGTQEDLPAAFFTCSGCEYHFIFAGQYGENAPDFCPNCGAKVVDKIEQAAVPGERDTSQHEHKWVEKRRVTEPNENGLYMLEVFDGSSISRTVPSVYSDCECGDSLISPLGGGDVEPLAAHLNQLRDAAKEFRGGEDSLPLPQIPTNQLLHRLWTKAVGMEGYIKEEWMELESRTLPKPAQSQQKGRNG